MIDLGGSMLGPGEFMSCRRPTGNEDSFCELFDKLDREFARRWSAEQSVGTEYESAPLENTEPGEYRFEDLPEREITCSFEEGPEISPGACLLLCLLLEHESKVSRDLL